LDAYLTRISDSNLAAEQVGFRAGTTLAEGLALTLDLPKAGAKPNRAPQRETRVALLLSRRRSASKPPKNPSSWFFTDG
jgi:hypothetical protein